MNPGLISARSRLTTPRAAAVAGILFSILLIISLVLVRLSVPADPKDAGAWLESSAQPVTLALNLVPFAGIAFLWFIGVIRDRLGEYEDKLFSTVFLGSGLLFLAMLFASAASAGGVITAFQTHAPASHRCESLWVRPRDHLRADEHLRDQNGRGLHALELHALRCA